MKLFKVLFVFDLLGLLVELYFFVDGLKYAYEGPDILWLPMLAVPALVLGFAWALKAKGRLTAAKLLLGLLALPYAFALCFTGLFILFPPDFK